MKKTINGLLLAMAVCGGSAYGADYEDDRKLRNYFNDTLDDLGFDSDAKKMKEGGVGSTVHTARQVVEEASNSKDALETLVQLLKDQGIDVSSKTPDEIKKLAQEQIKLLDQKIKSATT